MSCLFSAAALHQGKCPGKKAFALVVALPKLSRSKKSQCDNMTKWNLPLIVFKVNTWMLKSHAIWFDLITNCLDFLGEKRNEAACMEHVMASKIIVNEHGLSSNTLRRLTRVPRRLELDMVVTECIGRNELDLKWCRCFSSQWNLLSCKSITEKMLFSGENMKILRALQALTADIASFFKGRNYCSSGMQLRWRKSRIATVKTNANIWRW